MNTSQNGFPVLSAGSPLLHRWVIPARTGHFELLLRHGSVGFLLAHFALWWAEVIEPVAGKILDDWGWAPLRNVRDGLAISNHCSGCAEDLNATKHGRGVALSVAFKAWQVVRIRLRLLLYRGCIRWGGDYEHSPVDGMHAEINKPMADVERRARALSKSARGKRLLHSNPGQRAVIFS